MPKRGFEYLVRRQLCRRWAVGLLIAPVAYFEWLLGAVGGQSIPHRGRGVKRIECIIVRPYPAPLLYFTSIAKGLPSSAIRNTRFLTRSVWLAFLKRCFWFGG